MGIKVNSKHIGIVSEYKVISKLLEIGYNVSLPIGDNCSYDLLIDYHGIILRCQVKTMRGTKYSSIIMPLRRCRINTKGYTSKPYDKGEIDLFLGYYKKNNSVYFYPFKNSNLTNSVTFKLGKPKNSQVAKINFAYTYKVENLRKYLKTRHQ